MSARDETTADAGEPDAVDTADVTAKASGVRVALALAVTVFLWGSVFPAIRLAMEAFDPAGMAAARYGTTSVVLALAALVWRPRLPRRPADLLLLGGLGLFGVFGYALALNIGELTLSASAASLVYNTTPVFTALMALAFLGERMGRGGWAGMALACAAHDEAVRQRAEEDRAKAAAGTSSCR